MARFGIFVHQPFAMGHYSTLQIGKHQISWKYDIPAYLSFLFEISDEYNEETGGEEQGYPIKIGFRTTAIAAINKLNLLGMDWNMVTDIYSHFYERLKEEVADQIQSEILEQFKELNNAEIKIKFKEAAQQFFKFSRQEELKDFTNFFIPMIDVSTGHKDLDVISIDGRRYQLKPEKYADLSHNMLHDPGQFFYEKSLELPPWIQIIGNLFDYELLVEFTEIISVVQIKLLLEASPPETIVELQLEDMVDERDEIADFHLSSAKRIIDKIYLYNKFFNSIMDQEELVKEVYLREQLAIYLVQIPRAKTNLEKGMILEKLINTIFSSVTGLEVIEKRMSTKDEEIDLVIKNSVSGTFWSSLMSPCFFVECKNWKTKVGTSEIRDFEMKIANHRKLVKIGFFVSYNGFTKETNAALKRSSREEYHIVLIDKDDIKQLAESKISTIAWLEKLIAKIY